MKKIKLVNLAELSSEEKKQVKGGGIYFGLCSCGCRYAGSGGSSSTDNACANADNSLSRETSYKDQLGEPKDWFAF